MDRSLLKRRAQEIVVTSNPRMITVGLVYLIIVIVLDALGSRVMSVNISQSEAMNYLNYVADGNLDYALSYARSMEPPPTAYLINFALKLVTGVVSAGFVIFVLNTIRGTKPCFGNLLDGFGCAGRVILLRILTGLFVWLWGLLLVVPGVIAYYRYSQALYILLDDPRKSPLQCIRESRALMEGHKKELFLLDLSFLGWILLGAIPYIGYAVRVWSVPYIATAKALFYERLRGNTVWSYTPQFPV